MTSVCAFCGSLALALLFALHLALAVTDNTDSDLSACRDLGWVACCRLLVQCCLLRNCQKDANGPVFAGLRVHSCAVSATSLPRQLASQVNSLAKLANALMASDGLGAAGKGLLGAWCRTDVETYCSLP